MELEHLTLNRVIGLTSLSNSSFIASPDGNVLYAAGCVCILYNPQSNKQVGFFTVSRAISCMHLSGDGKYLAIGERGHLPCVTVWDVKKQTQIRSYTGHEHGISSVQFSPKGKYLVSIGFKHDKQMMLHEWDIDRLVCVEKMENKVNALSFHASGDFFVTCGDRHLKWWYLVCNDADDKASVTGLNGRPASILKAQQDSNFIDVVCCTNNTGGGETSNIFCTTSSGMLCLIHEKRLMDKWVQLDSSASYCLTLTPSFVIVGGTSGDIFVFNPSSLEFITTLPRAVPLSSPGQNGAASNGGGLEFAACYGITSIPTTTGVAAMYADRSIFIWDVADIHNPIKFKSFVFHKACIWDLVFIEQSAKNESVQDLIADEPDTNSLPTSAHESKSTLCNLPSGTFATCGADNSVCLWNIDPKMQRKSKWKSLYSRDLLHCFQLDGSSAGSRERETPDDAPPDIELPDRQQVRLQINYYCNTYICCTCTVIHPHDVY
jgi:mitogen-activated protein kinase binding protein 1